MDTVGLEKHMYLVGELLTMCNCFKCIVSGRENVPRE